MVKGTKRGKDPNWPKGSPTFTATSWKIACWHPSAVRHVVQAEMKSMPGRMTGIAQQITAHAATTASRMAGNEQQICSQAGQTVGILEDLTHGLNKVDREQISRQKKPRTWHGSASKPSRNQARQWRARIGTLPNLKDPPCSWEVGPRSLDNECACNGPTITTNTT